MASEYQDQARAHTAVAQAVAAGLLPRITSLRCFDCHGPAAAYHHFMRYAVEHRLDVVALCDRCHVRRHLPDRRPARRRSAPGERKTVAVALPVALHTTLRAIAEEQHRSLSSLIVIASTRYAAGWPAERDREEEEARPFYADLREDDDAR